MYCYKRTTSDALTYYEVYIRLALKIAGKPPARCYPDSLILDKSKIQKRGDMDKDWPKQKRRGGRRDDITTEGVQTFDMTAAELCEHFRRMTLKSAAYRKRYERRRWGWGYE